MTDGLSDDSCLWELCNLDSTAIESPKALVATCALYCIMHLETTIASQCTLHRLKCTSVTYIPITRGKLWLCTISCPPPECVMPQWSGVYWYGAWRFADSRCIDFEVERGENPFDMPTPWIFPKWNVEMSSAAMDGHRGNYFETLQWGQTEMLK